MNTEFAFPTFPMALLNAQWAIWRHTLEMLESWRVAGNHASTAFMSCPAVTEAAPQDQKMPALAWVTPRRIVVANALLALDAALCAPALHKNKA